MSVIRESASRSVPILVAATAALFVFGCASSSVPPSPVAMEPQAPPVDSALPAAPAMEPEPTPSMAPPVLAVDVDAVEAGQFDNGKMWTFEYPPMGYFRETYDFAPDSAWFEHARLGSLRLPNCSASFVSSHGLVMTNHHCAREGVSQVSREGEGLLDNGFYARSLAEERPVEDMHVDQLIAIEDVSSEVDAALASAINPAARSAAREQAQEQIERRLTDAYQAELGEGASVVVELIALWDGARTSAYVFRRYEDVRLVMAPELQMGYFGGDPDNFTYPRYALDMSFLRVYGDDGEPLESPHYFKWSSEGVHEGDVVFVIGNPGSTSRLQTVSQLEYRRAVQDRATLDFINSRIEALQAFSADYPEEVERLDLRNTIFSLLNSQKAYTGIWKGLHDPVIMAKRADAERQFRMALERDASLDQRYSRLFDEMADIQAEKSKMAAETFAFAGLGNPAFTPSVLMRGVFGFQLVSARSGGAPEGTLAQIREALLGIPEQPRAMQVRLLTARLRDMERHLGGDSEVMRRVLGGRSPEVVAADIVKNSLVADSARAAAAATDGSLTISDPAIQFASAWIGRFGTFQQTVFGLNEREENVSDQLGRGRYEVYGVSIPPDATFSLRIADGVVTPYEYNGTVAPIYTTFYGLYDHYFSYGSGGEWDLPERWRQPPASLDLSTPMNFISTADIIGGNSGSPILNRDLEVVGLVFDGNIESLPGDYIYDPTRNRAVGVDARGIVAALDHVYDADRIVLEMTSGRMTATEEEADRVRR